MGLSHEVCLKRIDRVQTYTELFAKIDKSYPSWLDLLDRHRNGKLSLSHSLVLIHPIWYEHLNQGNRCPIRGPSRFDQVRTSNNRCHADHYWGYDCPFSHEGDLERDHYFPYSLGGPTTNENFVWLCKEHNMMKGSDIHMLDLVPENFLWLETTLPRLEELMSNSNH